MHVCMFDDLFFVLFSCSICSVPALLADNVVSGAYDTGYILAPQDCAAPSRILRNEAAGTTVGFFVLKAGSGLGLCKVLDRVTLSLPPLPHLSLPPLFHLSLSLRSWTA